MVGLCLQRSLAEVVAGEVCARGYFYIGNQVAIEYRAAAIAERRPSIAHSLRLNFTKAEVPGVRCCEIVVTFEIGQCLVDDGALFVKQLDCDAADWFGCRYVTSYIDLTGDRATGVIQRMLSSKSVAGKEPAGFEQFKVGTAMFSADWHGQM